MYICSPVNFNSVISITNIARNQVIKLMKKDGYSHNSDFVRVGVNSGGCSGLSYELKFDNKYTKHAFRYNLFKKFNNCLKDECNKYNINYIDIGQIVLNNKNKVK